MATVNSDKPVTVTLPSDERLLITREFDAPKHLVYRAWTEPELVRRWWSGQRGTMTVVEIDLRVGGAWRYVMEAAGGFEVAFHGEYREIVPNERIVMTEIYEAVGGEGSLDTITFTEVGGRTRLEMLMQLPTKADRDMVLQSGMEHGIREQMVLLEDLARSLESVEDQT